MWFRSQNTARKYNLILVDSPTHSWLDAGNSGEVLMALQGAIVVNTFQEGLDYIDESGEIRVIQGTHTPTKVCETLAAESGAVRDRCKTFDLSDLTGVSIYGGFKGDETTSEIGVTGGRRASYHWWTRYTFEYPSVLSGDLTGVESERAYHVVTIDSALRQSLLVDGISIMDGRADASADVNNVNGYGGGVFCRVNKEENTYSVVCFYNCYMSNNYASVGGSEFALKGALYGNANFTNTYIKSVYNNTTALESVFYAYLGRYTSSYFNNINNITVEGFEDVLVFRSYYTLRAGLYNSIIKGNVYTRRDIKSYNNLIIGDITVNGLAADITGIFRNNNVIGNCFFGTDADSSRLIDGIYNNVITGHLRNYFNNSISGHSTTPSDINVNNNYLGELIIIDDETPDDINYADRVLLTNEITTPPTFKDPTNNDYRQQPWSSGINAGDNTYAYGTTDLAGNPRIANDAIDIGCFELQEAIYSANFTTGVAGALISIAGATDLTADASGNAAINLTAGTYNFTVTAAGYEDYTGSFTIVDTAVSEVVAMEALTRYLQTFTVSDASGSPIASATITIAGQSLTTNSSGQASIELYDKNWAYSVEATTKKSKSATLVVDGAAQAIAITLYQEVKLEIRPTDVTYWSNLFETIYIDGVAHETNGFGWYYAAMEPGTYLIETTVDGYEPYSHSHTVTASTQYIYINIIASS